MENLFDFSPDIPADKEAVIQSQLTDVEREFGVRFLFAIESGSRAWGFPSPDSDYDVRFVYAHTPDWYLKISPGRDVIERPLVDDWDMNGWDVKKAIGLLLKPNPVVLEWLSSPIRYRWDTTACKKLSEFAKRHVQPNACLPHYIHLAKRQWDRSIAHEKTVNLKKYFYVLRPILAIRWVRMNPMVLPPMNFQDLVTGTDIPSNLQPLIAELLEAKAKASEIGKGDRIPDIDQLILSEFEKAQPNLHDKFPLKKTTHDDADQLFRDLIGYKELA